MTPFQSIVAFLYVVIAVAVFYIVTNELRNQRAPVMTAVGMALCTAALWPIIVAFECLGLFITGD